MTERNTADVALRCRGGCGATQPDDEAAALAGWRYLEITKGWRCGACERELAVANGLVGHDGDTGDSLRPDDRGALPKETASTILAPSVPRNVSNADAREVPRG